MTTQEDWVFYKPKEESIFKRKRRLKKKRKRVRKPKSKKKTRFRNNLADRFKITIPKDMIEFIKKLRNFSDDDEGFIEYICYLYFLNLLTIFDRHHKTSRVLVRGFGTFSFSKFPEHSNCSHREYLSRAMFKHYKNDEIFWNANRNNEEYKKHYEELKLKSKMSMEERDKYESEKASSCYTEANV
jgi:hypothetical protein